MTPESSLAYFSSAEDRPRIDIDEAISKSRSYVRDDLKHPKSFLTWISLQRSTDNEERKWVSVWSFYNGDIEEFVVVSIESQGEDVIVKKVDKPIGYRVVSNSKDTIEAISAVNAALKFSKDKPIVAHHYIYRVGLGSIPGSANVYWLVGWWPTIQAEVIVARPVVAVNMRGESRFVEGPVTWLALKKSSIAPREPVDPPRR
jgi:hypothetical protein